MAWKTKEQQREYDRERYMMHKDQILERRREHYRTHKEQIRERGRKYRKMYHEEVRIKNLRYRLGISSESASLLHQLSEGVCFLCGRQWRPTQKRWAIDHEHKTGNIRGVACYGCNRWLIKGGEFVMGHKPDLDLGVLSRYLRLELPIQAQLKKVEYTK